MVCCTLGGRVAWLPMLRPHALGRANPLPQEQAYGPGLVNPHVPGPRPHRVVQVRNSFIRLVLPAATVSPGESLPRLEPRGGDSWIRMYLMLPVPLFYLS